jgi:hypothetical protein
VAPSDSENLFSCQETCAVRKLVLFEKCETLPRKIFSSIAQIEESSKNYFAAKRRQTSSKRRVRDALDCDHRWDSTWIRLSGVTRTLSATLRRERVTHGEGRKQAMRVAAWLRELQRSRKPF